MMPNPLTFLARIHPLRLIAAITLMKALAFFAILPLFSQYISAYYSIDFADNYELLGKSLANGNGYRFTADTAATLMREPGYPLFLGALFSVFGFSLNAARIANLVFSFIAASLVAKVAGRLSEGKLAPRLAPALLLCHPGMVVAELRGGVECLFAMLLMFFFVAIYKAMQSRQWRHFFLAGLVLGITSTVRSTALLFPAFLLPYFFFLERMRPRLGITLARIALIAIGASLVLTPWIVRNYALSGHFVPTASVAGVSAHSGQYICTHMTLETNLVDVDRDAALERAALARNQGFRFKEVGTIYYLYFFNVQDELAFNSFLGKLVFDRYLQSPSLLATCIGKNAFHFWFSSKTWTATALNSLVQLPYIMLAIAGLIIGLRSKQSSGVALLGLFLLYSLGVYLPILAQARYSLQLMPILSILGALALSRWYQSQAPIVAKTELTSITSGRTNDPAN